MVVLLHDQDPFDRTTHPLLLIAVRWEAEETGAIWQFKRYVEGVGQDDNSAKQMSYLALSLINRSVTLVSFSLFLSFVPPNE